MDEADELMAALKQHCEKEGISLLAIMEDENDFTRALVTPNELESEVASLFSAMFTRKALRDPALQALSDLV